MMKGYLLVFASLTGLAITLVYGVRAQVLPRANSPEAAAPNDTDRDAIRKTAREFADAFNQGDAKAIAGMWTENGESRDSSGRTFLGRAAIEKAYEEFFKAEKGAKIEVLVKSVRFPAKDLAIEKGLLRSSRGPKHLPDTTAYVAVHIREAGKWRLALTSEGDAGLDRLEDLDWLLGDWTTKVQADIIKISFARDPVKPHITGTFTRTAPGKEPVSRTIRIALDPETAQIRSWSFEDDGSHSQALWVCDGKSWVLDTRGVLADGTATAERIVVKRVSPDIITWQAIDRLLGDIPLQDTPPMRLTRSAAGK